MNKSTELMELAKKELQEENERETVEELKERLREIGDCEKVLAAMKKQLQDRLAEIDRE